MSDVLACPWCGAALEVEPVADGLACGGCGARVGEPDGVLDLVTDPDRADERAHYEREYAVRTERLLALGERRIEDEEWRWSHPAKATNGAMLRMLGDLRDRRVLLIGNGGSWKELWLLTRQPRLLVVSDLTVAGVRAALAGFDLEAHRERLCGAAIDALALPVRDHSVDVLYGNAIVHHLPDVDRFLAEVARVLAPGGRAVFLDDAFAPDWQAAKLSLLKPLMRFSHRRDPRSPEDRRATLVGGFKEDDLAARIRAVGGTPLFERHDLVFYLWTRAAMTLAPRHHVGRLVHNRRAAVVTTRMDDWLGSRFDFARRNQVRLIWGMTAPAAEPAATQRRAP